MLDISNLKESSIVNKESFKKCVVKLVDRYRFSYIIEVSNRDDTIVYSVCHKRSPIPCNIGEIELSKGKYKLREY